MPIRQFKKFFEESGHYKFIIFNQTTESIEIEINDDEEIFNIGAYKTLEKEYFSLYDNVVLKMKFKDYKPKEGHVYLDVYEI